MLTPAELHHQALRFASAGNRAAKDGQDAKARGWWRFAARKAGQAGDAALAADMWRRAGNEERARESARRDMESRGDHGSDNG